MRISLDDIQACSECPAYYQFVKGNIQRPIDTQTHIASQVIKRAYTIALETGFRASWRRLVGQVDTLVFKDVSYDDAEQFEAARKTAEHILNFTQSWYNGIYLEEDSPGYVAVRLDQSLGSNVIEGDIPIITLESHPLITYIDSVESTETQMYNNLKVRGLLWLVSQALECDNISARHLTVGPFGGFKVNEITVSQEDNKKVTSILSQVAYLISNGMNFPSVTEKCNLCAFKRRCRI